MATQRIYAWEIEQELLRIMRSVSFASTLKTVQPGNLSSLPMQNDNIDTSILDAIFIECTKIPMVYGRGCGEVSPTYNYRLLYLHKEAPSEIVEQVKLQKAGIICDLLYENPQLNETGSVLAQVDWHVDTCRPVDIDLAPVEEKVFEVCDMQISVIEITIEVLATAPLR